MYIRLKMKEIRDINSKKILQTYPDNILNYSFFNLQISIKYLRS